MRRKIILVVDDAPENLDLLVGLLKPQYQVKAAINGALALKIATASPPPDLILMDIVMPGENGIEICRQLKESERTAAIPVIFLSGNASAEESEEALDAGGEAYLKKPIDPESLFSLLDVFLPVPGGGR